jgi:hypothetical protein
VKTVLHSGEISSQGSKDPVQLTVLTPWGVLIFSFFPFLLLTLKNLAFWKCLGSSLLNYLSDGLYSFLFVGYMNTVTREKVSLGRKIKGRKIKGRFFKNGADISFQFLLTALKEY